MSLNKRNKSKFLIFVVIAVVVLGSFLVYNTRNTKVAELDGWDKYIIIGKENAFAVYEDKLALQIPYDVNISKEKTLGDLIKTKNYEDALSSLNEVLPEKIENFTVMKKGSIDLDVKNKKKVPEISVGEKRYILTSSLSNLFLDLYYDDVTGSENRNIIIELLNANGRSGYARQVGNKIRSAFSYKYNAANFETFEEYSYIKNKNLSEEQLKDLIMELDEKYFKISDDGDLPTLANAVIVLGREQEGLLKINIVASKKDGQDIKSKLNKIGYKNLESKIKSEDVEKSFIEYGSDDYYTAYKLAEKLEIKNMIENKDLKDRVNIFVK